MESASLILYAGVIILVYICTNKLLTKQNAQLPPGPRGLPVVGNVLDLPRAGQFEAHHWAKHKDLYGMLIKPVISSDIDEMHVRKYQLSHCLWPNPRHN